MAKPRPAQITYELLEPDFVDRWVLVDQQRILRHLLERQLSRRVVSSDEIGDNPADTHTTTPNPFD